MSTSYQSKDSRVLGQQLKVQEVVIRFADLGMYSVATNDVIVDLGETLSSVFSVIHNDNSGPNALLIAASAIALDDSEVTVTLAAPFAANDSLVIRYIVSE